MLNEIKRSIIKKDIIDEKLVDYKYKKLKLNYDINKISEEPLRILEFFCGIGGMRYAFEQIGIEGSIVESFDINTNTNLCYMHNFHEKPNSTVIDSLKAEKIDSYNANCWLMSPPCQPYTRKGKQLDDEDSRAAALLNLIDILPKLSKPPKFIFVENVVNFEKSNSREKLIKQLDKMGYEMNEHLVTPLQFGIPNNRTRYYLSARKPLTKKTETDKYFGNAKLYYKPNFLQMTEEFDIPSIYDYCENLSKENLKSYYVPDKYFLKKYNFKFDIVNPKDKKCSCFTKAYGSRHIIGTGSFLQTKYINEYCNDKMPNELIKYRLRFFTPNEIALLHAFPITYEFSNKSKDSKAPDYTTTSKHDFSFPETMTRIQRYKALGNSLNVYVVAMLLKNVLFNYNNKDFK